MAGQLGSSAFNDFADLDGKDTMRRLAQGRALLGRHMGMPARWRPTPIGLGDGLDPDNPMLLAMLGRMGVPRFTPGPAHPGLLGAGAWEGR